MSQEHHKKIIESSTIDLFKRALEYLINLKPGSILNGEKVKKINFSYGQVIKAINEIASPEEILNGVIISDPSTISKNKTYKLLIATAKSKYADKEIENSKWIGDFNGMTEMEYKVIINNLMAENTALKNKNISLESIIKQAEVEDILGVTGHVENEIDKIDGSFYEQLLKELIELSIEVKIAYITPQKKGIPAALWFEGLFNSIKIANIQDLRTLELKYHINDKDNIIIEKS